MSEKEKRSYFLPNKLLEQFDREADRLGYFRDKVVAAAIASFLKSGPDVRAAMFEDLERIVKGKRK